VSFSIIWNLLCLVSYPDGKNGAIELSASLRNLPMTNSRWLNQVFVDYKKLNRPEILIRQNVLLGFSLEHSQVFGLFLNFCQTALAKPLID